MSGTQSEVAPGAEGGCLHQRVEGMIAKSTISRRVYYSTGVTQEGGGGAAITKD